MFVVHFLELCVVLFEEMSLFIVCSICSSCYSHVNLAFHMQSTHRQLRKHSKYEIFQKLAEISA